MSQGHFSRSSEIAHLLAEVRRMSAQELYDSYGIEFVAVGKTTGPVYDTTSDEEYKDLNEWAQAVVDEERSEYEYEDEQDDYGSAEDY